MPAPWSLIPTVDVVVEVIGGIEPARTLILTALKSGKPVVTANKELLANCGAELFEAASLAGVDLLFESAVAGGIPLIRPASRVAGGRADPPDHGHRQRDHQLHPEPDERIVDRAITTPWPKPRAWGTRSAIRPPTSRATTPPPRPPSWPTWRSGPGSSPATSTEKASAPSLLPISLRPATSAMP